MLINLGLPTAPTVSIQQEGRIYRVGQASDAMFRYFNTGTQWERFAFAERVARRAGAAENLAMGEDARGLTDSFIEAFENSAPDTPGGPEDGKGGKARDRALATAMTEFQRAKTFYFSQLKRNSKTKALEGEDYFATPEPLGQKMVEWAGAAAGQDILEPSAGHGAIARWFPDLARRTVVEPSFELASRLGLVTDAKLVNGRFEDFNVVNKFDTIVMNPPFGHGGATAIRHLDKAVKHLRNGGRVVALIPEGPAADKAFEKWYEAQLGVYLAGEYGLPRVTFERAGTAVKARIVILDKVEVEPGPLKAAWQKAADDAAAGYRGRRELSAETVNEFFDRIENMDAPPRVVRPDAATEIPQADTAPQKIEVLPENTTVRIEPGTHSKTGAALWYGRLDRRVEREEYLAINAVAKKHGGYYSNFKGGGAKPGFIFTTEEAANAFAAEVNEKPMASQGRVRRSKLTAADVETVIDQEVGGLGARVRIHAVTREEDLPERLRPAAGKHPHALYDRGYVWIIAENNADKRAVATAVAHEVFGHMGPMAALDNWPEVTSTIAELVESGNPRAVEIANELRARYPEETQGSLRWAREFLALAAEKKHAGPITRLLSIVRAAIRRFLKSVGLKRALEDAEIDIMLREGEAFLRAEGAMTTAGDTLASDDGRRIFYSALLRAVQDFPMAKATAEQWRAGFKKAGVREEEIKWLDIDGFLAGKRIVNRDELAEYVRASQVEVREVVGGGPDLTPDIEQRTIQHLVENGMGELNAQSLVSRAAMGSSDAIAELEESVQPDKYDELMRPFHIVRSTRYGQFQTPGGVNYQELLLTLPPKAKQEPAGLRIAPRPPGRGSVGGFDAWIGDKHMGWGETEEEARAAAADRSTPDAPTYKSGHWDEPNILTHVRFNERAGADGKRTLFIEEVQSDWHQKGRQNAYAAKSNKPYVVFDPSTESGFEAEFDTDKEAQAYIRSRAGDGRTLDYEPIDVYNDKNRAVPDAPFKTTWPMLAMKRMIRWAAENGFERVAWTTGDMQNERYSLGTKIQGMDVHLNKNGTVTFYAFPKDATDPIVKSGLSPDEFREHVGAEIANEAMTKLQKRRDEEPGKPTAIHLSNKDMTLGGSGMKGFYDKILPSEVGKYIKKWGGKVGQADLAGTHSYRDLVEAGQRTGLSQEELDRMPVEQRRAAVEQQLPRVTVHAFDITPSMRDSVMGGQPLFSRLQFDRRDDGFSAALKMIGEDSAAFAYPRSNSTAFRDVVADVTDGAFPDFDITRVGNSKSVGDVDAYFVLTLEQGKGGAVFRHYKNGTLELDVSDLKTGEAGSMLYQIAGDYAHNNGLVFVGDRHGLSAVAQIRRTDNMLSSAVRWGTTKHLLPHALQRHPEVKGVPPLVWRKGNDPHNLREMARVQFETMVRLVPEIRDLSYNFDTRRFEDTKGREVTDDQFDAYARAGRSRDLQSAATAAGMGSPTPSGRRTLKRAVFLSSLSRGTSGPSWGQLLAELSRQHDQSSGGETSARLIPEETFYSQPPQITEQDPLFADGGFDLPNETVFDWLVRNLQDKFRRVKILQRAISQAGGTIDESRDAYLAEELFHGRVAEKLNDFTKDLVDPLIEAMRAADVTLEQLDEYLYAKHAPERNAHIAEIREDMQEAGSGMSDEEAAAILDRYQGEQRDTMDALADRVYTINHERLALLRAEGLEHPQLLELWESQYENYVPLRGFVAEPETNVQRRGRGFDIRGKESKRALGRRSTADSPLLYSIAQMEESIIRAEKNRVGKAFLNLVLANPNQRLWTVTTNPWGEFRPVFDQRSGEVVYRRDPLTKWADNVLSVKRDGKEYLIALEDEGELLARAFKNMGPDTSNVVVRALSRFNRYLATVNTSANPEFVMSNLIRDLQTAMVNLVGEQDVQGALREPKQMGRKVVKDIHNAMRGVFNGIYGREPQDEWTKWYNEFRQAGGKISFYSMQDLEAQRNHIRSRLAEAHAGKLAKSRHLFNAIGEHIGNINAVVENGIRLSTYANARRAGLTKAQAASLARNLTVNFTRKGEFGNLANALYLFYNASIQGSVRLLYAVTKSARVRKIVTGLAVASFTWALMNRWIGGDDDDGESRYDKIPNWVKTRNIIFMRPDGSYWKFPLPYGYNVPWVMGTYMERAAMGRKEKSMDGAVVIAQALVESFNPLGGADSKTVWGWASKVASPTILDPFVELGLNEDFAGRPVRKEQPPYAVPSPNSQLYFNSVSTTFKNLTAWLNAATGGDELTPGWADINPENLDYIAGFLTGGVGQAVARTLDLPVKALDDEQDIKSSDIPFYRRFRGEAPEYYTSNRYHEIRDNIRAASKREDAYYDAGEDERLAELREEKGAELDLAGDLKASESKLRKLYKQRTAARADKSLTGQERKWALDAIESEIEFEQKAVIRLYNDATQ
ncbi:MAG: hypothetical protein K2Y51_13730 [Gammaproteobacteria bacterium]|nr:hypothetical protein [Gammaproteobacteria bacterium]